MDDMTITLPLDSDGFLRRECPDCRQQFKWHSGPANEEVKQHEAPAAYYCPFCGSPAEPSDWFTAEQMEYAEGVAQAAVLREMRGVFADATKGNKFVTFTPGTDMLEGEPAKLVERDDMQLVASPCHDYELVKVPEPWSSPLHCLVCGQLYAL